MSQKVGANEPCPCGSGKKYKRCCALEDPKTAKRRRRRILQYSAIAGAIVAILLLVSYNSAARNPQQRAVTTPFIPAQTFRGKARFRLRAKSLDGRRDGAPTRIAEVNAIGRFQGTSSGDPCTSRVYSIGAAFDRWRVPD